MLEAAGAPTLSLSSVGAITFVNANAADYERDEDFLGEFTVSYQYAADIMGASGGKFLPAALATLRTHAGVGSYGRRTRRKRNIARRKLRASVSSWRDSMP